MLSEASLLCNFHGVSEFKKGLQWQSPLGNLVQSINVSSPPPPLVCDCIPTVLRGKL